MSWAVTSTISGGMAYGAEDLDAYASLAHQLKDTADALLALAGTWSRLDVHLHTGHSALARIGGTAQPGLDAASGLPNGHVHIELPYRILVAEFADLGMICQRWGQQLSTITDGIIRAYGLYSQAEYTMRTVINRVWQLTGQLSPPLFAASVVATATLGMVADLATTGQITPLGILDETGWAHEGLLLGLTAHMPALGSGMDPSAHVNRAAGALAGLTAPIVDAWQGSRLSVEQVKPRTAVMLESHSVADAMRSLRRLAEERLGTIDIDSGLDYATIAIQRYRRPDGASSWLVSIPGTDGQGDSPFGWAQNIELMSSNAGQRMRTDSAAMVAEAMDRAGIGPTDPVALIGHSQGGIVAAAIASDMAHRYAVRHVVTAGSPVANHPISGNAWVTSIEMDNELVAGLDGAPNPNNRQWLTIRGTTAPAVTAPSVSATTISATTVPGQPVVVPGTTDSRELTHWLKYHQAAYEYAANTASPAVAAHERHFQQVISGELEETTYWRGRMSSGSSEPPVHATK